MYCIPDGNAAQNRLAQHHEVRLRQGDSASLLEQVQNGRLDLAFLPLLDPPDDIVTAVIVDFEVGWGTRPLIDRAFAQAGIQRRTAFDVTDIETLIDLISQGLGIGLLPGPIAELRGPRIVVAGLIEPEICWELVVAHPRCEGADPENGTARSFLNLLNVQ